MLFNSLGFILIFLPITFFVYFALNKAKLLQLGKGWLVLASLFFYSFWNIAYLPLILISMIFNYSIGTTLNNPDNIKLKINRKLVLTFGVVCNLLLLGYYKYFDFFIENINVLLKNDFPLLHIILPLGISFFTFTQIAYLVDAYKQQVKEADFMNYALFVTFFPHLIAGPILHHSEMMPQFSNLRNKIINPQNITFGIILLTVGLFKKIIIADNLAEFVKQGFDIRTNWSFLEAWVTSLSFTFQLYFDFSGYTDMALGIAMMFNIFMPKNFNSPYKARNIQDFWRRWHMTLSRFLKDYIYIPLGGNRLGEFKTYKNLFITFLLGGIWHGAAWTFVIWGALHGVATSLQRIWGKLNFKMPGFIAVFITFVFVNITWVFFRSQHVSTSIEMIKTMLGITNFSLPEFAHGAIQYGGNLQNIAFNNIKNPLYPVLICFIFILFDNFNDIDKKFKPSIAKAVFISLFFCWLLFNMNKVSEFLYFNF